MSQIVLDKINLHAVQAQTYDWLVQNILTQGFVLQLSATLVAAGLGLIAHRMLRPRIQNRVNALKINYRMAEILRSLTRLIFPIVVLLTLLISINVLKTMDVDCRFGNAVIKLLMAWIGIRFIVNFIANPFARKTAAIIIYGIAALSIFGILDETAGALDSLGVNIGSFRLSALTVTKGVLALAALIYIANVLANLADRQINKVTSLSASSRVLITKIARVFLIITALLIGVTTAGIDLSLLAVFSGAVGLGIGFGLQKGISNLFSGMLLLMDESIKPGDIIELPVTEGAGAVTTFGWVNHMGARYTEIVTRDNKSFLVPNEDFITQKVVNWSHGDTLVRLEVKFGVHYNSNPHQVKELAEKAAVTVARVVETPTPLCWLTEFGDSGLNFVLRFWIKDAEKGVTNVRGQVLMALWEAFKQNGVQIPYPHREVYIHNAA